MKLAPLTTRLHLGARAPVRPVEIAQLFQLSLAEVTDLVARLSRVRAGVELYWYGDVAEALTGPPVRTERGGAPTRPLELADVAARAPRAPQRKAAAEGGRHG